MKRGDIFVVEGTRWISKLIRWRTGGLFSHAGIVLNGIGQTLEALPEGIVHSTINQYKGQRILIVRPQAEKEAIEDTLQYVQNKWLGSTYPYWRLIVHLIGFDNWSLLNVPVCSELAAYYEKQLGLRNEYWGINPDDLGDEWILSDKHEIIYRGRY